jgi:hypothetical protein
MHMNSMDHIYHPELVPLRALYFAGLAYVSHMFTLETPTPLTPELIVRAERYWADFRNMCVGAGHKFVANIVIERLSANDLRLQWVEPDELRSERQFDSPWSGDTITWENEGGRA